MIEQLSRDAVMHRQGTEDWMQARNGKVTASRVKELMAKTKSGYSTSRNNLLMELLCQRLTGEWEESYNNAAMQRGTDLEPLARAAYEIATGDEVTETGFVVHPIISEFGASPDGLVGEDGLIEIKIPNTAQHVACLRSGKADPKYLKQMLGQMACTGRKWCDFVSFDDRLPEELQLFVVRVPLDNDAMIEMIREVSKFLKELNETETEMREKMETAV